MITTPLCPLLGIEHPIIGAPMAGTAGARLAAAVSEAGALGMIGVWPPNGPDWLRTEIAAVRALTDRPFGVGFVTSAAEGYEDVLQVVVDERVPVVSHSFADPTPFVADAQAAGAVVMAQIQKLSHAERALEAGVDVICAQSAGAGGHTGYSATVPLVLAVLDRAGDVPVVAAGGYADGRGLASALVLGASGVWMGTRFVLSEEADRAESLKRLAVDGDVDDTVHTKVYDLTHDLPFPSDIADRMLANRFIADWDRRPAELLDQRAELATKLDAAAADDPDLTANRVGSAIGQIEAILPAAEIVHTTVAEAEAVLRARTLDLLPERGV